MWFELAGARALAQIFEGLEEEYADDRRAARRSNRSVALWAAVNQQNDPERIPEPTVSHARRGNHPVTDPPRRTPAIQAPHQAMIAALNKPPDGACDCHRGSQLAQFASKLESISQSMRGCFSFFSRAVDHLRQKRISFSQCPAVKAGTRAVSGNRDVVHGCSQKSDPIM